MCVVCRQCVLSLSNGPGSGAELNSWERISITQVVWYTVYWLGQCVLSVNKTKERGRAELGEKDLNNAGVLLHRLLGGAMLLVS